MESRPPRPNTSKRLILEMGRIAAEDYGPTLIVADLAAPGAIAEIKRRFLGGSAWTFIHAYGWMMLATALYLIYKAHLNLSSEDQKRIAELEKKSTSTDRLKISIDSVLDRGQSFYYFRGRIKNDGNTIKGVLVRAIKVWGISMPGVRPSVTDGIPAEVSMNLQWTGAGRQARDIHNGQEIIFDIGRVVPKDPPEMHFCGWEGQYEVTPTIGPGRHLFQLQVVGEDIESVGRTIEFDLEGRFNPQCVKLIQG